MNQPRTSLLFSARNRRALLLGFGTMVLAVTGRGYPAWRNWELAARDEADRSAVAVARLVAAVRGLPAARDSVAARTRRLARLRGSVITASSSAHAAAALVAQLSSLVNEEPVRVLSMSVRSSTPLSAAIMRVAVRVSVLTEIDGLAGILCSIEGGPLLLVVRELSIEPAGAMDASTHEQLRVEMVVEALAFVGGSPLRYAQTSSPP